MAIVVIESPNLDTKQKATIGAGVTSLLEEAGIALGSIVIQFRQERGDLFLGGNLVTTETTDYVPVLVSTPKAVEAAPVAEGKATTRRSKPELEDLKDRLMAALQEKGSLSSFEAQGALGLKECDWAPATLRRLFTELEEAGCITKSGQKRGTRYVWNDTASALPPAPLVMLVKGGNEGA